MKLLKFNSNNKKYEMGSQKIKIRIKYFNDRKKNNNMMFLYR